MIARSAFTLSTPVTVAPEIKVPSIDGTLSINSKTVVAPSWN